MILTPWCWYRWWWTCAKKILHKRDINCVGILRWKLSTNNSTNATNDGCSLWEHSWYNAC